MSPVSPPDEFAPDLLERLVLREPHAFTELVRTYGPRVSRLVVRMVGSEAEAEDVTQEVFVQVFKAIDSFRGDAKLSTWIYRISVNVCKNRAKYHRVRHSKAQDDFDAVADHLDAGQAPFGPTRALERPDDALGGRQVERIVQQAIACVDPNFRDCLVLRDVEDLSYEEIAVITGLPTGTVKSRIFRARAQLRQLVEERLGEKLA
jgi:RNA polymerase sigma-70 factor (ECF subfamily)